MLPTVFGVSFGILLVLMVLGGLNFNNNLALILSFLLAAAAQLTTYQAYRNLVMLKVSSVDAAPGFAGGQTELQVALMEADQRARELVEVHVDDQFACRDISANENIVYGLELPLQQRGYQSLPRLRIATRFPLGLFRAWSWINPDARVLVYPAPDPSPPPLPRGGAGEGEQARVGDGDAFHGLRGYQVGDPLNRIAWRASARHDGLLTQESEIPVTDALRLSLQHTPGRSLEARLSTLCAWVLQANRSEQAWSLDLGDEQLPMAAGRSHRDACLKALALHT